MILLLDLPIYVNVKKLLINPKIIYCLSTVNPHFSTELTKPLETDSIFLLLNKFSIKLQEKYIIPYFCFNKMPLEMEESWQEHLLSKNYKIYPPITFEYSFISEDQFHMIIVPLSNMKWTKSFVWSNGIVAYNSKILVRIENPGFRNICLSVLFSKNRRQKKT